MAGVGEGERLGARRKLVSDQNAGAGRELIWTNAQELGERSVDP